MRMIVRTSIALLIAAASFAYASVPPINVIVSDSAGKAAYKGATDAKGTFATGKLKAGNYVVQFNSNGAAKEANYALVVSAGKKKVTAESVPGAKFAAGGVAMKIDVAEGLNIAGQVTTGVRTMVDKNGKKMVWIPKKLGSNLPAHWAPEDSAEAKEAMTSSSYSRENIQSTQNQGISPH